MLAPNMHAQNGKRKRTASASSVTYGATRYPAAMVCLFLGLRRRFALLFDMEQAFNS
jgi:hypothetical protein